MRNRIDKSDHLHKRTGTGTQHADPKKAESLGIAETRYFIFHELVTLSGGNLSPVTLAYETYGILNSDRSNAILILHAFSGDAHAAGFHEGVEKPGWWDILIGPGKGFDTDKYFVICSNVIGGCKGSTGPSSINPETGKPYGLKFPMITIDDMVNAQRHLIDHLGIDKLLAVAGGSMGGMQVLQWMASYPERIRSAIPIAATVRHTPQQIAFNEVGRQAIMADPNWKSGDYYDGPTPAAGLAVARMVGHITYMSERSLEEKTTARRDPASPFKPTAVLEVEQYLSYQGNKFVERFDANSYLFISKAMDHFDLSGKLTNALRRSGMKALVIAFKTDWLYPPEHSKEIVRACKMAGGNATYCEIDSPHGHDSFLLESEQQGHLIRHFLEKVVKE
ncbi:MAG: homoserine O-acetyltransferase [Deltaproteobacteria bacterium]|nr:homoserine O-acetyltransferase [Deltaproteobacteria bacterium]